MKRIINTIFLLCIVTYTKAQVVVKSDFFISKNTLVTVVDDFNVLKKAKVINDGTLSFRSNLINNGLFSFSVNSLSGNLVFEGENQSISGDSLIETFNLLFNNNSTFLEGSIQIENDAVFQKGIVNNRIHGGTIIFNELSDHLNSSNLSFVDGKVIKKGKLDFTYPIGAENIYREISIEALEENNNFEVQYYIQNSNIDFPHDKKDDIIKYIDENEFWKIEQKSGNDYAVIEIARNVNTSSFDVMNADLQDIHIVRWDTDKEYWVDEGGIANPTTNAIRTVSKVTGYGNYALAVIDRNKVLPGDVVVYNNLTPNGDGVNDTFIINGIEKHPDNVVKIFNRWGVVVSEIKGYNNKDKSFKGFATSRLTFGSDVLPSGTYYYVITYQEGGATFRKIDYLYINGK